MTIHPLILSFFLLLEAVFGGTYIYITDNNISNCNADLIGVGALTSGALGPVQDYIYVERNILTLSDITTGNDKGFVYQYFTDAVLQGTNIFIRDNKFYYTETEGTYNGIRLENADGLTISGNEFYGNEYGAAAINFGVLNAPGYKNITITQNYVNNWAGFIRMVGAYIKGIIDINKNIIAWNDVAPVIYVLTSDLSATSDDYLGTAPDIGYIEKR